MANIFNSRREEQESTNLVTEWRRSSPYLQLKFLQTNKVLMAPLSIRYHIDTISNQHKIGQTNNKNIKRTNCTVGITESKKNYYHNYLHFRDFECGQLLIHIERCPDGVFLSVRPSVRPYGPKNCPPDSQPPKCVSVCLATSKHRR